MNYLSYLTLIVVLFCSNPASSQSGWVREAKGLYIQTALTTFSSNEYYSTSGQLFDDGSTFNSRGLLLYGEYGITDRFTALLDVPLVMLNSFSSTETVAGVGDVKLGVKYQLIKSFPLALQIDFSIPTDDGTKLSDAKEPNSIGIIEQINLPTSDGEFNVWTTLAVSQSTANGKTFGSLYGRVNFRTQSFSHQLQAGLEIGHLFFNKLYLIGKLGIQEKLSSELNQGGSFLYGEGTTFTSAGITAIYKLSTNWRLVATVSDYNEWIIARRNIYDGLTFSLGIALEY